VTTETRRYLDLLEQRLTLLGSLADALTAAGAHITSLDIDALESRVTEQAKLCMQIHALDVQLKGARQLSGAQGASALSKNPNEPDAIRCRETVQRLSQAQNRVKQLNDAQRALLRRSRRTVSALLNSYHSFAPTYCNPVDSRAAVFAQRI
jgi:hypothetical protein